MKIHLEKAIFINRAPFDGLELDFIENEIAVLTATNGRGKTTILSHIVDAFYEMAKPHFLNEFEDKANKYYRLSSAIYNLLQDQPSFVYLRFKTDGEEIDYLDIRNICTEDQYNEAITIENKIQFSDIRSVLEQENGIKKVSSNFDKNKANIIFSNNILTFFPSYRFEMPGYLNDPYKVKLDFKKQSSFSGLLINPIEVITGLPQLANWIMDIILDLRIDTNPLNQILFHNLNLVISQMLISKNHGSLRFGVGPRGLGGTRIQILKNVENGEMVYPTIFNLSSGESSILCLFGEIIRQADNIKNNIRLLEITGIILIDEVDKHLHIRLQKEILPKLFQLFPNVQFLVSSHSPFLSMGLADVARERSKIVDLDNLGISKDPTNNELYTEVYKMMIGENKRFKEKYQLLQNKIQEGTTPLIITEGKTDVQHLRKAKEKLNIENCDVEFYEIKEDWDDSKLKILLEQLSKVPQTRKIIGIFDRDVLDIVSDIEKNGQLFKNYNNNVYGLCIPVPEDRKSYTSISIEFYYSDAMLKKEKDGKCLHFDNEVEFRQSASNKKDRAIAKLSAPKIDEENTKKIFDDNIGNSDWIHSKARFASLVEIDEEFISDFDFSNFNLIFERIKSIINPPV